MESLNDQLLSSIDSEDLEKATRIMGGGVDLNANCEELQGAPALFLAILKGNISMVNLLLEHGADPNRRAIEPAASIYTETALALARQARMLMNWNKYHPIVELLERFGATDEHVITPTDLLRAEAEAKEWQAKSKNVSNPTPRK